MKNLALSFLMLILVFFVQGQSNCLDYGTGVSGAYHPSISATLVGGTYNFTSFTIDPGLTVNVTGNAPLIIRCTGTVVINGILTANGGNGTNGLPFSNAGTGGIGAAGGGNGGNGYYSTSLGGQAGFNGFYTGGGIAGLDWSGGGGGGYATAGSSSGGATGGFGGVAYGTADLVGLFPGSGGGGGSGGFNCGSGGGGAGGGVIVINTDSLILGPTGIISSNGGNGGSDDNGNCGGGGGGSGGAIWLGANIIVNDGLISANGGIGGLSSVPATPYFGTGGNGSDGRIRIDFNSLAGSGTINPSAQTNSPTPVHSNISDTVSICNGDFISVGSSVYATTGVYLDTLTSSGGCDSIVQTVLTVSPPITGTQTISLCAEDSVTVGVNTYNTTGNYQDTLTSALGCDSIVTTNLTMLTPLGRNDTLTICFGDSVSVGSNTYTNSGIYTDVFVGSNGCDSTLVTNLTIDNQIDTSVSVSNGLLSSNQAGASYIWLDCDNGNMPISGATNQTFSPTNNGNYAVVVELNNCADTSACANYNFLGIRDIASQNVQVYPNPTNGEITIKLSEVTASFIIAIHDNQGKLVRQASGETAVVTLNLEDLNSGIYYMHLSNEHMNQRIKFIRN